MTAATVARSIGHDPLELVGCSIHGSHSCWGDARVLLTGETLSGPSTAEILVVDDLTVDHLPFLPLFLGVVIASNGPWEGATPGTLVDDFRLSALGVLLRRMDIPHAWNISLATAAVRTGDLINLDPQAHTFWCLSLT
jgi:hypothetical protein